MPDFEALIRHQQLKQPSTNQRLKIVDNTNNHETPKNKRQNWVFLTYFGAGLIGALIGSLSIIFLEVNKFIPIELLKLT